MIIIIFFFAVAVEPITEPEIAEQPINITGVY